MFRFGKERTSEMEITISNKTVLRVVALVLLAVFGFAAVRQLGTAFELIFTAFFLALALNAPVQWLAGKLPGKSRGSRTLATVISTVVIVGLLITFIASLVPPIIRQTENFIKAAPGYIADIRNDNNEIGKLVKKYNLEEQVENISKDLSGQLNNLSGTAFSTLTTIGEGLFKGVTVLVMTFMMLVEGPRWIALIRRLIPKKNRERVSYITNDMYRVVKGYVNGQVTLASIAAILMLPVLLILGISYPFALIVIVFVCGLIPMIGHYIGASIITLVALFHSPVAAIIILAFYILYQQIENYAIQPRIQASMTNMSPLLVFVSVILGASFGGLLGALVAIPVAGCLRILIIDILKERDILNDDAEEDAIPHVQPATKHAKLTKEK